MTHPSRLPQSLLQVARPIGVKVRAGSASEYLEQWGRLGSELSGLLESLNGFYAFGSALLVRPFGTDAPPCDLAAWNAADTWKIDFSIDLTGVLCFAEDLFGDQFCIRGNAVVSFDPETTEFKVVADSIGGWARVIADDPEYMTGFPLEEEWETIYGPLAQGQRLVPKMPFVLGGPFEVSNLYVASEVEAMRTRAVLANQIKDVPDGSEVVIRRRRDRPGDAD